MMSACFYVYFDEKQRTSKTSIKGWLETLKLETHMLTPPPLPVHVVAKGRKAYAIIFKSLTKGYLVAYQVRCKPSQEKNAQENCHPASLIRYSAYTCQKQP